MFNWISQHSTVIIVITTGSIVLVRLIFLLLMYAGLRSQWRPQIVIGYGKAEDHLSRFVISNMSSETIYVDAITAELQTSEGPLFIDVTGFSPNSEDDEDAKEYKSRSESAEQDKRSIRQGPLDSDSSLYLDSFNTLAKRMAREKAIEMSGHRPKGELRFLSLTIHLVAIHGPKGNPVGAERSFKLVDSEHGYAVTPMSVETRQLTSIIHRKRLRKFMVGSGSSHA
ncbi:hypothetical protein [Halomonas sp. WWR20]